MDHFQIQEHFVLLLFDALNEMSLEIRIRPFLTKLVLHILLKHVKPALIIWENVWKFNFLNFDNRTASSHRKWSKMHRNGLTFENGYFVHVLWHKTYDIFGEHPPYY